MFLRSAKLGEARVCRGEEVMESAGREPQHAHAEKTERLNGQMTERTIKRAIKIRRTIGDTPSDHAANRTSEQANNG